MKYYLYYSLCLVLILAAGCDDSETLENRINFESPYVITDEPNDAIQHRRFLIFEKYRIPVFFNDTISKTQYTTDRDGKPLYRYETLDLNWSFSSHNMNKVEYVVDYITDEEAQAKALNFVEAFLEQAAEPMRPFSIFLPNSFTIKETDKAPSTPEFWSGFRTLVIPNVQNIASEKVETFATNMLRAMVKDNILKATNIIEQFGEVSDKNKYYNKPWVNDGNNGGLGCVWGIEHKGTWWKPEELYNPGIASTYIRSFYSTNVTTEEEFNKERDIMFEQIGKYGFISGNTKNRISHKNSPSKISEDVEYYIDTMLNIGSEEFLNRYGKSPLVLKKYNILADYINGKLGVKF